MTTFGDALAFRAPALPYAPPALPLTTHARHSPHFHATR